MKAMITYFSGLRLVAVLSACLCIVSVGGHSQSNNCNYILTRTFTSTSGSSCQDQVDYFDGLGRPEQSVLKHASPNGGDIVTLLEYDHLGRESNQWNPVGVAGNSGRYVSPDAVKSRAISMYSDSRPYAMPVYESSPLNRLQEQYGSGEEWHTRLRSVKTSYLTNVVGNDTLNCICYSVSVVPGDTALILKREKNYDSSQLSVTRMEDEDGNASFVFKDKLDQVLLTRQVEYAGTTKRLCDTYYMYDDFGNRLLVLPPEASDAIGKSSATSWNSRTDLTLKNLAYLYTFDYRNRCIGKKLPGCSWNLYVYDKVDQLIFSQDGEQRRKGEWSFSIPDALGRMVLTGTCGNTLNYAANPLASSVVKAESTVAVNGPYKGYTLTGTTLVNPIYLSVSYYDHYAFLGKQGIPNNAHTQYTLEPGYNTCYGDHQSVNRNKSRGLLTGTLIAQMLPEGGISNTYLYSVMYYDDRSRVIQVKSSNHLTGGLETEFIAYNFTGQPVRKKQIHAATGQLVQTEVYDYSYDHAMRLTQATHELNHGPLVVLAENQYDELGRLLTSTAHSKENLKTSYSYNVRSWINEITSIHFKESLTYSYGGNIIVQQWTQAGKNRKYAFAYDNLSRLKSAVYTGDGNFSTSYSYDKHGNIKSLQRYGNTGVTTYGLIDNLTMGYNGNQLVKADDTGIVPSLSSSTDFRDGASAAVEYYYDLNGNLTKDLNKGISEIQYNSLNLPRKLVISNAQGQATNGYTYAADGRKLSVSKHSFQTDYAGNVIYEDGVFKRLLVEGGYYEGGKYHFYVRDHLGNNRVVADQNETVIQSTQYYPFGMAFADGVGSDKQPYKYNDKEFDGDRGLNWYDYVARQMESDKGRFTTMDPMAEKKPWQAPYVYCSNNPMSRVDPDGKDDWEVNQMGYFKKIPDTKSDIDKLYVLDKDNLRIATNPIELPKGALDDIQTYVDVKDPFAPDVHRLKIDNKDEKGKALFEFLSNNTKVEWSHAVTEDEGVKSYISTSHEKGKESGFARGYNKGFIKGDILEHIHNHLGGNPSPSPRDKEFKGQIEKKHSNIELKIYISTDEEKYHSY